jgi:hypothetical protein
MHINYRGCAVRPPPEEDPPLETFPPPDEAPLELSPELLPLEYPPLETEPPEDLVADCVEPVDELPAPDDDVPCSPCAVLPPVRGRTRV